MAEHIASLPLSGRVVLLSMTQLSLSGETPVHTGQVIQATKEHLEVVEADTIGKLDEAEVNRALNSLEADDIVEMADVDDTTPVGKGRPAYTLSVDIDTVLDTLDDDDEVAPLVKFVRSES